jgi:mono/diheme cytochrome c family protein
MKRISTFAAVLIGCMGLVILMDARMPHSVCWCWPHDHHLFTRQIPQSQGNEYASYGSYGSETDWNNPQRIIPLDYRQTQGKRIFYEQCVWCHADSTPAGPSNRSNVSPDPPLMNDGTILNKESDAALSKIIAYGGPAAGKSKMMPSYGMSLSEDEIDELIAYLRAISSPEYRDPSAKGE